jgi:hypothetical protein
MPVDVGGGTGATEPTTPATSTAPNATEGGIPTGTLAILAVVVAAFVAAGVILPLRTARNR